MDAKITEILVCPLCKGPLLWNEKKKEFYFSFFYALIIQINAEIIITRQNAVAFGDSIKNHLVGNIFKKCCIER